MPQQLEPLVPERIYHIFNHAIGSEDLFREPENYRFFLQKYRAYIDPIADTYAYCLLPNHFHLMVATRPEAELRKLEKFANIKEDALSIGLSQKFSHLFNGYTQAYNKRFARRGSLFMDRFKRKRIISDEYFTQVMVYIHNNPVNHGFVNSPGDWPYSSWHLYMKDNDADPGIK